MQLERRPCSAVNSAKSQTETRPAWVESMTEEQQLVLGRPHQRQKDYGTGVPAFPARLSVGGVVDGSTGRVLSEEEARAKL